MFKARILFYLFFPKTDISVVEKITDFNRGQTCMFLGWKICTCVVCATSYAIGGILTWLVKKSHVKNIRFDRKYLFNAFQCYWYINIAPRYITGICEYYVFINDVLTPLCDSCTYLLRSFLVTWYMSIQVQARNEFEILRSIRSLYFTWIFIP